MERFTADGEDSINKEWLVFDNEEFYCCFGPTTQLNAVTKARELNEKHAGKDEVSALKTRITELEKERDVRDLEQQVKGVKEALAKVKWMGGGFLNEYLFEDRIHDLQTQAKELKEQGND